MYLPCHRIETKRLPSAAVVAGSLYRRTTTYEAFGSFIPLPPRVPFCVVLVVAYSALWWGGFVVGWGSMDAHRTPRRIAKPSAVPARAPLVSPCIMRVLQVGILPLPPRASPLVCREMCCRALRFCLPPIGTQVCKHRVLVFVWWTGVVSRAGCPDDITSGVGHGCTGGAANFGFPLDGRCTNSCP